jgi:hypothetical protein
MNDKVDLSFACFYIAIAMIVVVSMQLILPLLGIGIPL